MRKVIDVSSHNGEINWDLVKGNVDGAIIRLGYGSDMESQDDKQAERNLNECERLGIPYGVYLYSYALSKKDVMSEIEHTQRLINSRNPQLGVWFDMEDADGYKTKNDLAPELHTNELTEFCEIFTSSFEQNGYTTGVYASKSWFDSTLSGYTGAKWIAHWYDGNYDDYKDKGFSGWQYTSDGTCEGIDGRVDISFWYDFPEQKQFLAQAVIARANYVPEISLKVNIGGRQQWLGTVSSADSDINNSDTGYAGVPGRTIEGLCIHSNDAPFEVIYAVSSGGDFFPDCGSNDADINNDGTGYAGVLGRDIDRVCMYLNGNDEYDIEYQVRLLGGQILPPVYGRDANQSDNNNGYAGIVGRSIEGITARIVRK